MTIVSNCSSSENFILIIIVPIDSHIFDLAIIHANLTTAAMFTFLATRRVFIEHKRYFKTIHLHKNTGLDLATIRFFDPR